MISLLSSGVFTTLQPDLDSHPDFRRATQHQKIAFSAASDCLKSYSGWETMDKSKVALVVGTQHGELESTLQFLHALGETQTARPLFFQNSFHNATAGFLSKAFDLTGASLTVSQQHVGQSALQAAEILLESQADYCLVVVVDSVPSLLSETLRTEFQLNNEVGVALLLGKARG